MGEKNNKLDPEPLVKRLIEKSKAGKLNWEPTADRRQFVTSVGGDITFRIRLVSYTDINEMGQPESVDIPRLDMLDEKGYILWQVHPSDVPQRVLRELFEIARRIGNQLDDRVEEAIHVLDNL